MTYYNCRHTKGEKKNNYHEPYDEEFKKSIVTLHQNGRTQSQLAKEYGISTSAINKWIKQYSTVKTEDRDVLTAKQIKELQKRNAQLEEENLILNKAIAIFEGFYNSKRPHGSIGNQTPNEKERLYAQG